MIVGLASVSGAAEDHADHPLPQRQRPHMQVIVTERGRAQDLRVGEQIPMLVGEVGTCAIRVRFPQRRQRVLRALMIADRGGQPGLKKLGPSCVSADHACDFGGRHPYLCRGFGHRAGQNRRVDRQTVADAPDTLPDTVVRAPDQVYLAQLRNASRQDRRDRPARCAAAATAKDPWRWSRHPQTRGDGPAPTRRESTRLHHKSVVATQPGYAGLSSPLW